MKSKGKVVRLTRKQLRTVLSEAIQARLPGDKEPFMMDERFGVYDVEDRSELNPMMPHNFEASHRELFIQALKPVMDEFVESLMEMYEAGFPPEHNPHAKETAIAVSHELLEELLGIIAKYTEVGVEEMM